MTASKRWDDLYDGGGYKERWEYAQASAELTGFVASGAIPEGSAVLDVGCGAGREILFLAQRDFRAVGADWSASALRVARGRAREENTAVSWCRADALRLPFRDASFMLLNDRGCFHHVARESRAAYAAEAARVLRPGGRLFLRARRASGNPNFDKSFVILSEDDARRFFAPPLFSCGPVLPVNLISDTSSDFPAFLVAAERLA